MEIPDGKSLNDYFSDPESGNENFEEARESLREYISTQIDELEEFYMQAVEDENTEAIKNLKAEIREANEDLRRAGLPPDDPDAIIKITSEPSGVLREPIKCATLPIEEGAAEIELAMINRGLVVEKASVKEVAFNTYDELVFLQIHLLVAHMEDQTPPSKRVISLIYEREAEGYVIRDDVGNILGIVDNDYEDEDGRGGDMSGDGFGDPDDEDDDPEDEGPGWSAN